MQKIAFLFFFIVFIIFIKTYASGPSCSEEKISCKEFEKLANSESVNDIVDFLKVIPKNSLQSFSFATTSLSAQAGEGDSRVTEEWPRVIRSSTDGKLTFTYTCNPKSPTHNSIEVLCFENEEFRTMSLKLKKPPGIGDGSRTLHNPKACVQCHSQSTINGKPSIKPNWPEYFFWSDCKKDRGIRLFGSSDDNMSQQAFRARAHTSLEKEPEGCDEERDRHEHTKEVAAFSKFKERQKDNPCYALLPWVKKSDSSNQKDNPFDFGTEISSLKSQDAAYPYSVNSQSREEEGALDYKTRTNLRFNDTYSHLNARRIFNILKKSPEYNKIKYYIALESASCLERTDEDEIKKLLPDFKKSKDDSSVGLFRKLFYKDIGHFNPSETHNFLYSYSLRAKLAPSDWSLEYNKPGIASYNAGMPGEPRDLSISEVVGGLALEDLAKNDSKIAELTKQSLTNGVRNAFGDDFACIDNLGRAIKPNAKGKDNILCKTLREQKNEHFKKIKTESGCTICAEAANSPAIQLSGQITELVTEDQIQSIARGKELIQSEKAKCLSCHSRTPENLIKRTSSFMFMPSTQLSKSDHEISQRELRSKFKEPEFKENLNTYLLKTKEMPLYKNGETDNLSDKDRQDIFQYISSLAN